VGGASVLDVGCEPGYGLDILARSARDVWGQDIDPRLAGPRIHIRTLESFSTNSFDVVVSVDVIEHVQDDLGFVTQLARIARQRVMMTTPNWTAGRCTWQFHVREYTPGHLRRLGERFGRCELWKGTPDGSEVYAIHLFASAHRRCGFRKS
jgi:2-polyprenyl-3-methyl-5-hydroxy-6-metoxy-1,4-benzoquinol methylase